MVKKSKLSKLAYIVREYRGFIILAQSEHDYRSKCNSIDKGDTFGFYRADDVED